MSFRSVPNPWEFLLSSFLTMQANSTTLYIHSVYPVDDSQIEASHLTRLRQGLDHQTSSGWTWKKLPKIFLKNKISPRKKSTSTSPKFWLTFKKIPPPKNGVFFSPFPSHPPRPKGLTFGCCSVAKALPPQFPPGWVDQLQQILGMVDGYPAFDRESDVRHVNAKQNQR